MKKCVLLLSAVAFAGVIFGDHAKAATINFGGSFSGTAVPIGSPPSSETFSGAGSDTTFGPFNITESADFSVSGSSVSVSNGSVTFDFTPGGFTASFIGSGNVSGSVANVSIDFTILSGLLSGDTGVMSGTGSFDSATDLLTVNYSGTITGPGPLLGFVDGPTVDVSATPLPATLPLFVSGVGCLGFLVRRRKRKQ